MAKSPYIIIGLLLIVLVISAGCIVRPPSSSNATSNNNQKQTTKYGQQQIITLPTTIPPINDLFGTNISNLTPNFRVGQIAQKSSGATTGLAIVDYNNVTGMYGTLEVKKNSKGNGWYTDGFQLIVWKGVATVDKDYKFVLNFVVNPTDIPEYDSTKEVNVFLSQPCDLVGDWNVNKGASIYKFRLDNIVVNQTGNQTKIGDWKPVRSKDKRDFVINWHYGPSNDSANFMERITLSSDYSKFDSVNNYGYKTSATWIGVVPSWKAELDKANPEKQVEISAGADCYKWLGGDEWYNK